MNKVESAEKFLKLASKAEQSRVALLGAMATQAESQIQQGHELLGRLKQAGVDAPAKPASPVPGRGQGRRKVTCDEAMRKFVDRRPEAVYSSVRQWEQHLDSSGFKKSTIQATPSWKSWRDHRAQAKAQRAIDDAKRHSS